MDTYLGIDGGGSGSRALVVDENGILLWRREGPSANCRELSKEAFWANLDTFWENIQREGFTPVGVAMGLSGVVFSGMAEALVRDGSTRWGIPQRSFLIESDLKAAHRGAFQNEPGITLISGTGSSCLGRNTTGGWHQCGGWGSILDDAGSGYQMGLAGLRLALRMRDGREARTGLEQRLFQRLEMETPQELVQWIHDSGNRKPIIANLFLELVSLEKEGDPRASDILKGGRNSLVEMVVATARALHLPEPSLILAGSVAQQSGSFGEKLKQALLEALPDAKIVSGQLPPEAGAILGFLEYQGARVENRFLENLKQTLSQPFSSL